MPRPPPPRPLLLLLFLISILQIPPSHARSLRQFQACLPHYIPLSLRSTSPNYRNLSTRNFVNNRASPVAIVLPRSEFHVIKAVQCARQSNFRICTRSGGHSLAGTSMCNGILIDVGAMRRVAVLAAGIARIEAGANMGEVLWALWHQRRRWFASGVCPGVGVGGYVFGGGHGPYEGTLGLACDALVSVRMVDRFGRVVVASRRVRPNLFWALCGAGGGQFGVVTSFKVRTAAARIYDRAVVFRFKWPHFRIGELMERWMDYGEAGGRVWFRLEMYLGSGEGGMVGYGACYDVGGVEDCMDRLRPAPFFNTPGRSTDLIFKARNALEVHAFFGPEGGWARRRPRNLRRAMLQQRYTGRGEANARTYQSTFLKKRRSGRGPTRAFWQRYADFCRDPGRQSIPWVVCELNLFNNAIDRKRNNSFAHRDADIITHYIIGGGAPQDQRFAYRWMKNHLRPFTTGVYVNYPELQLRSTYPRMYWGSSLPRLKKIKRSYDPTLFFANPQPIPRR